MSAQEAAAAYEAEIPEIAFQQARKLYFESVGQPTVESARRFVIICVLCLVILGLLVALLVVVNKQEVQPWVVKVDESKGTVTLEADLAKRWADYKPERAVLEREFTNVLRDMYALNASAVPVIEEGYKRAFYYMRDTAANQFREFIRSEDPYNRMRTIAGLSRTINVTTITFRNDARVVLVRFQTEEQNAATSAPIRKNLFAQLTYVRVSDMNPDEIRRNPLGVYIVNFEIQEER